MTSDNDQFISFDLEDLWGITLKQRKTIGLVFAVVVALTLAINMFTVPTYRATNVVRLALQAGQEVKTDKVVDLDQYNRWNRDLFAETQLEVLHSLALRSLVMENYLKLGFDDPSITSPEALIGHMFITAREGTELLDISVDHVNPESAAALANLIAEGYRELNLNANRDAAEEARSWIEAQLLTYEEKINVINGRVVDYQRTNNITATNDDTDTFNYNLISLSEALAKHNTERVLLKSQLIAHEQLYSEGKIDALSKEIDTPLLSVLNEEYARALTAHAKLSARYGEKHHRWQLSQAEFTKVEEQIRKEVRRTINNERAALQVTNTTISQIEEQVATINGHILDSQSKKGALDLLQLELERARVFYADLSKRDNELELQARTQLNNVQIIDMAVAPSAPYKPNTPFNLMVGLLIGVCGGLGVGFAREYFTNSITSPQDVKLHLRVPYLGHVPKIIGEDRSALALHTHTQPDSAAAEATRSIRTLLDLNPLKSKVSRLLVTSTISAEGKTGTSIRLAIAFARLGRKVLLVDADLRRPTIHKVFNANRSPGLTQLFDGASFDTAVNKTEIENLSFLPAGATKSNGIELLASPSMSDILDTAQERFDLIIIDTPPAGFLADAAILSRGVDGVLFVVREYTASRVQIKEALQGLHSVGANIFGVVINAVDLQRHGKSYNYYGYGYGYGYSANYRYVAEEED
jgi:succinoglycan biosynthesis transport protein ExoP